MQGTVLLASKNKRLRTANERQVKKRQVTRKFISKETILAVADAQRLVTSSTEVTEAPKDNGSNTLSEIVVYTPSPNSRPRGNRAGLPSYYIYNRYNHSANKCTKVGESSI
jgi:hypothetical protein